MDDAFVGDARTAFQLLALLATVLSGCLLRRSFRARARLRELRRAESPPLRDLPDAGTPVLVSGTAGAGPLGLLRAPHSGTGCVWYRAEVWEHRPDPGSRYEGLRSTLVSVEQSSAPFVLGDRTGTVRCYPRKAVADRVPLTHAFFAADADEAPAVPAGGADPVPPPMTPGRCHREWAIVPGAHLLVHGTVYTWDGAAVVADPPGGSLTLSTRTAPQLRDAYRTSEFVHWGVFLASSTVFVWLVLA
ncbi:hypothetical protein SUDANB121_00794 [Nocardiopsis dassonvillei]|uniref:GIDE domain-containing protein n=1 Tax=Nocardiopsis dassonvillei TaxID=2014 RepID=UPI003F572BAD